MGTDAFGERLRSGMLAALLHQWLCPFSEESAQLERIQKFGEGPFRIVSVKRNGKNFLACIKVQEGKKIEIETRWLTKEITY